MTLIDNIRVDIGDDNGAIPSGVPSHELLSTSHGDTNISSPSQASVIVGVGAQWTTLPSGAENFVLMISGGAAVWGSGTPGPVGVSLNQTLADTLDLGNIANQQIIWLSGLGNIQHLKGPLDETYKIASASGQSIEIYAGDVLRVIISPTGTQLINTVDINTGLDGEGDGTLRVGNIQATSGLFNTVNITGPIDILHTSIESDDHALEIDINAEGFGDVKAIDISYITGPIATGSSEGALLINLDESSADGGVLSAIEILGTKLGTLDGYHALTVGIEIDPILQFSGTFGDMDSLLVKAIDQLSALSLGGAGNVATFIADNDTITIGDIAKFEEIEIIIDTGSSANGIAPLFEFSTGLGLWTPFTPVDGTNGFRLTGSIAWEVDSITEWTTGLDSEYLIRITRTKNNLSITPILDMIQLSAVIEYNWNKDGDINVRGGTFAAPIGLPVFTVSTLPTPTLGHWIFVSDETGGAVGATADGANWRRTTDRVIVS